MNPNNLNNWSDLPADRHDQGCGVAFADGHAVRQRWKSPKNVKQPGQPATPGGDLQDLREMQRWIPLE